MLVLRGVVWKKHDSHTSVFLIKNVFGVGVAAHELVAQLVQVTAARRPRTSQRERDVLELTTAKQHT